MTTIKEKFIKRFGIEEAELIERCAIEHSNGVNSRNKGKDPFKWALLICIGYQCFEIDNYRKYHGFKSSFEDIKAWIIEEADLGSHNGDCDYLSMITGKYDEYIK